MLIIDQQRVLEACRERRQRLCQRMLPNSVAIIPAAKTTYRNRDVENPWRQDSHFDYLTAIDEEDCIALVRNVVSNVVSNAESCQLIIFCQKKDPTKEVWDGPRLGCQTMLEEYHANEAYELDELDERMPKLLQNVQQLYFDWGEDEAFDRRLKGWLTRLQGKARLGVVAPQSVHFLSPLLGELRLIKDTLEQQCLRQAGQISVIAHRQAMRQAVQSSNEKQVTNVLESVMVAEGCQRLAFGSIVAAGKNACVLHYRDNNQSIGEEDLMIIDAGGEFAGYASDITTAFPCSGRFSRAQADRFMRRY